MAATDEPFSTHAGPASHPAASWPHPAEREARRPQPAELAAAGLTWVHLDRPDEDAVAELAERFGWHALDVEDVLSKRQRPKIDEYPDYLFVVLHFPFYDKSVQRLNAAELDVFLGPDYVVTLPTVELLPVTRLFSRVRDDQRQRESSSRTAPGACSTRSSTTSSTTASRSSTRSGTSSTRSRTRCSRARSVEVVRDLSNVKQEIISYRKIIKPQRSTLRVLERHVERFLPEELELYFDDIVDAAERIWDLLDNYKEVVEALEDTNESVISHRQNDVLRLLTLISVTMLPLTLITEPLRHERRSSRARARGRLLDDRGVAGRGRSQGCSASSAASAGSSATGTRRACRPPFSETAGAGPSRACRPSTPGAGRDR